jgi:hypothetical protein
MDADLHDVVVFHGIGGSMDMSGKDVDGAEEENECVAEHGWKRIKQSGKTS